ncbi:spexin prohormone 1-like [Gambusia affinis]|uniref:spexin prohormone 1-like n=1 Tax=Gambusia affinis TaxID=33528 RepID=UPI001CDC6E91|nr:spexin prohormone 1-like [Gambusia affinis]
MSLKVPLLVVLLVSQCWSAPYRRNWTPQAILYLKGAQGHRSTLERSSREEGDALQLVNFNQIDDGLGLSSASVELLQQAAEEGGGRHVYRDSSLNHL